jgi:hypothetical protein
VLLRWIKFYDDRAVGLMDRLQKLVPDKDNEPLSDVPEAAVVRDLEAKLKVVVDAATDYAAKAAKYIHACRRLSTAARTLFCKAI